MPLCDYVNTTDIFVVMLWAVGHGRETRKVADTGELRGWRFYFTFHYFFKL